MESNEPKIKYLTAYTFYEIVTENNYKYKRMGYGKWEEIKGFHLHRVIDEEKIQNLEEMLKRYILNLSGE